MMDNKTKYINYLKQSKSISTARGYISSLKMDSVVGDIVYDFIEIRNIFEINDISIIEDVYKRILSTEQNTKARGRLSAAVKSYIEYLRQSKEKN